MRRLVREECAIYLQKLQEDGVITLPKRHRQPWSDAERFSLRDEVEMALQEIAKKHERTISAIRYELKRMRVNNTYKMEEL